MNGDLVHDDIELATQVLSKGYKIKWCDEVIVYTPGGQPNDTKALWNQKTKGNVGWRQMKDRWNYPKYVFNIGLTYLKNLHKITLLDHVSVWYWTMVFVPNYLFTWFLRKKER